MEFVIPDKIKAEPGKRFLNYIIDLVFRFFAYLILLFSLAAIGGLISGFTGNKLILNWIETLDFWKAYFSWLVSSFLYYYTTEVLLSRSVAKFITATIVILKDGSKPNNITIIKRTLCRFVPILDFVSFLYVTGLHDGVSNTFVVKKAAFEETVTLFYSFNELGNTNYN
jgi:uncharacterized RDD family membrane protein YckC